MRSAPSAPEATSSATWVIWFVSPICVHSNSTSKLYLFLNASQPLTTTECVEYTVTFLPFSIPFCSNSSKVVWSIPPVDSLGVWALSGCFSGSFVPLSEHPLSAVAQRKKQHRTVKTFLMFRYLRRLCNRFLKLILKLIFLFFNDLKSICEIIWNKQIITTLF